MGSLYEENLPILKTGNASVTILFPWTENVFIHVLGLDTGFLYANGNGEEYKIFYDMHDRGIRIVDMFDSSYHVDVFFYE